MLNSPLLFCLVRIYIYIYIYVYIYKHTRISRASNALNSLGQNELLRPFEALEIAYTLQAWLTAARVECTAGPKA